MELVNEMRDETRQDKTSVVVVVYYYSLFPAFTRTTQASFPMPSTYRYIVPQAQPRGSGWDDSEKKNNKKEEGRVGKGAQS